MRPWLKVTKNGDALRDISERKRMKQLNVLPMLIMLIVIVLLVVWLRPHG